MIFAYQDEYLQTKNDIEFTFIGKNDHIIDNMFIIKYYVKNPSKLLHNNIIDVYRKMHQGDIPLKKDSITIFKCDNSSITKIKKDLYEIKDILHIFNNLHTDIFNGSKKITLIIKHENNLNIDKPLLSYCVKKMNEKIRKNE